MMMKNWLKKAVVVGCAIAISATALTGCGGGSSNVSSLEKVDGKSVVSVMLQYFSPTPMADDSPVKKALEDFAGVKFKFMWTPAANYGDKMNSVIASGNLPNVMLVNSKSANIINGVQTGKFWEIGPYLKNYPHLSKANPVIQNNISIDGKIYGVYRSRTLGRNGMTYRADWLNNVGLKTPETLDDLYTTLKAFTLNDPDKNGKNDTYGMIMTNVPTTIQNLVVWFGAPNGWGADSTGNLVPAFKTPEYFEALKFIKKLYDEKLINTDFPTFDSGKWNEQFVAGKAGVIIDTADRSRKIADNLATVNANAVVNVLGTLKNSKGERRSLPTSGYAGYFMFPKSSVKTEADLKTILTAIDKLNSKEGVLLTGYGVEGTNYTMDKEGYIVQNKATSTQFTDLNQFGMNVDTTIPTMISKPTKIETMIYDVQKENEKYVISNPAEPLVSNTYATKGPSLDDIIKQATTKFVVGQMTEAQFKAEIDRWYKNGGTEYVNEINDAYKKAKVK